SEAAQEIPRGRARRADRALAARTNCRSVFVCSRRSLSSRSAPAAHLTKGNETPPTLVPKHEAHAAEALKQRKPGDAPKLMMVAKRPWQPVIGDAAAQMMYMVHADVR